MSDRVEPRVTAAASAVPHICPTCNGCGLALGHYCWNCSGTGRNPDAAPAEPIQARVGAWMLDCFGAEIAADREERGDRFLEEVFELLQSGGYDPARVLALRDYVWGREIGEPSQEVGGVVLTLSAYCNAFGLDVGASGEAELSRVSTPEMIAKIRAKQAAKPTGSALPIAVAPNPGEER